MVRKNLDLETYSTSWIEDITALGAEELTPEERRELEEQIVAEYDYNSRDHPRRFKGMGERLLRKCEFFFPHMQEPVYNVGTRKIYLQVRHKKVTFFEYLDHCPGGCGRVGEEMCDKCRLRELVLVRHRQGLHNARWFPPPNLRGVFNSILNWGFPPEGETHEVRKLRDALAERVAWADARWKHREYYRDVWGFDPVAEWNPTIYQKSRGGYYEAWFDLDLDPVLYGAGLQIGAMSRQLQFKGIKQRILFRRKSSPYELGFVNCVHLAIWAAPRADTLGDEELLVAAESTENKPVELPLEEHFVALKSYAHGIAEIGLLNCFAIARSAPELSFGFNTLMQKQVIGAINGIAPGLLTQAAWDYVEGDKKQFVELFINSANRMFDIFEVFEEDGDDEEIE